MTLVFFTVFKIFLTFYFNFAFATDFLFIFLFFYVLQCINNIRKLRLNFSLYT